MNSNQFHRFTYIFTTENQGVSEIVTQIKSEGIQKQLKKAGILSFEIYQKDQAHFLLVDADTSFNSEKALQLLKNFKVLEGFNTVLPQHNKALERIYELNQKKTFTPTEGQLKTSVEPFKRFVWTLLLESNLIEEYKQVHALGMAWPEITANMKSVGVKDMEIYLSGAQAFLIMDTVPDFDLEEVGPKWQKLPREEEWQTYVAQFQRTDPDSSIQEKWKDMGQL